MTEIEEIYTIQDTVITKANTLANALESETIKDITQTKSIKDKLLEIYNTIDIGNMWYETCGRFKCIKDFIESSNMMDSINNKSFIKNNPIFEGLCKLKSILSCECRISHKYKHVIEESTPTTKSMMNSRLYKSMTIGLSGMKEEAVEGIIKNDVQLPILMPHNNIIELNKRLSRNTECDDAMYLLSDMRDLSDLIMILVKYKHDYPEKTDDYIKLMITYMGWSNTPANYMFIMFIEHIRKYYDIFITLIIIDIDDYSRKLLINSKIINIIDINNKVFTKDYVNIALVYYTSDIVTKNIINEFNEWSPTFNIFISNMSSDNINAKIKLKTGKTIDIINIEKLSDSVYYKEEFKIGKDNIIQLDKKIQMIYSIIQPDIYSIHWTPLATTKEIPIHNSTAYPIMFAKKMTRDIILRKWNKYMDKKDVNIDIQSLSNRIMFYNLNLRASLICNNHCCECITMLIMMECFGWRGIKDETSLIHLLDD